MHSYSRINSQMIQWPLNCVYDMIIFTDKVSTHYKFQQKNSILNSLMPYFRSILSAPL